MSINNFDNLYFNIQEIVSDPQFIVQGTSRFDLYQGELGEYINHNVQHQTLYSTASSRYIYCIKHTPEISEVLTMTARLANTTKHLLASLLQAT